MNDKPLQVDIRQAKKADLKDLEWDGEYKHFRRLYADIFQRAQREENILWVADIQGIGVVGQLFVQLISSHKKLANGKSRAYIFSIRVRPRYRNQKIGTLLIQTAERDLTKRGFKIATLNVGRDNPDALRLYEHLGYHVVGHEEGRWSYIDHRGRWREIHEPSWRMEKMLEGSS